MLFPTQMQNRPALIPDDEVTAELSIVVSNPSACAIPF
jgi:hypothetical protein